jgi:polar amino acid transport system substrate-binding protein
MMGILRYVWHGAIIAAVVFAVYHQYTTKKTEIKSGDIVVGTSADFPPFSFIENGHMVGFDVDIMEEVARRLGKSVELKNMPFSTLLPALQLGTMHIVAAGLTATPERAKHVLFTQPYLDGEPLVIVSLKTSPIATVKDLGGKEVVVNQGYTADLYMSAIEGVNLRRLKSPADAFLALTSSRADAFVTAQNTVKPFFKEYGHDKFVVATIPGTQENSAMAVAPQYQELREQIDGVLDAMKNDGTLEALRTKWGL